MVLGGTKYHGACVEVKRQPEEVGSHHVGLGIKLRSPCLPANIFLHGAILSAPHHAS